MGFIDRWVLETAKSKFRDRHNAAGFFVDQHETFQEIYPDVTLKRPLPNERGENIAPVGWPGEWLQPVGERILLETVRPRLPGLTLKILEQYFEDPGQKRYSHLGHFHYGHRGGETRVVRAFALSGEEIIDHQFIYDRRMIQELGLGARIAQLIFPDQQSPKIKLHFRPDDYAFGMRVSPEIVH